MNLERSLTGDDIYRCSKTNILSSKRRYININHHVKSMWILKCIDSGQIHLRVALLLQTRCESPSVWIIIRLALWYKKEKRKTSHYVKPRQMRLRSEMSIDGEHTADRVMITTSPKLFIWIYGFFFFFLFKVHIRLLERSVIRPTSGLI